METGEEAPMWPQDTVGQDMAALLFGVFSVLSILVFYALYILISQGYLTCILGVLQTHSFWVQGEDPKDIESSIINPLLLFAISFVFWLVFCTYNVCFLESGVFLLLKHPV